MTTPLAPLATPDDLASYARKPVDPDVMTLILDGVSASIRSYCRWPIAPTYSDTVILDSDGGQILQLPSLRVTAVDSVTVDGSAVTDFTWSQTGMLYRQKAPYPVYDRQVDGFITGGWPCGFQRVSVTYTGGYDVTPDDVRLVCLSAAKREYLNPGGYERWSIGGVNYQMPQVRSGPTAGAFGSVFPDPNEMRVLGRYRIQL